MLLFVTDIDRAGGTDSEKDSALGIVRLNEIGNPVVRDIGMAAGLLMVKFSVEGTVRLKLKALLLSTVKYTACMYVYTYFPG